MLLPEKDHDSGGPHQLRLFLTPSSPATTSEDHHHHQLLSGILTPSSQASTSSSTSSSPDDENRQIHRPEEAEPVQQPPLDDQQEAVAENDSPELAVKLLSTSEFINDDDDDVKTPTSPRCRIPAVLSCPPAPRKPKSRPITTKRKLEETRRVLFVDLSSDEIESLFSPRAADLRSGGGVKRVRQ
ncbi:hypothetical protein LINGRAHAP2_LOCUS5832 [Linum grandiflorum]